MIKFSVITVTNKRINWVLTFNKSQKKFLHKVALGLMFITLMMILLQFSVFLLSRLLVFFISVKRSSFNSNYFVIETFFYELHFIDQFALARRQRRDLSAFESSCHLPTCLPQMVEALQCPLNCWKSSMEVVNTNFYNLWLDLTSNRTRFPKTKFLFL